MADFNVQLHEDNQVSIINLQGYLDAHTAPDLENIFTKLIDRSKV